MWDNMASKILEEKQTKKNKKKQENRKGFQYILSVKLEM